MDDHLKLSVISMNQIKSLGVKQLKSLSMFLIMIRKTKSI